jgi:hypothetical protein
MNQNWIPLTNHEGYEINEPNVSGEWQIRKKRPDGQYKAVNQNLNKKLDYLYVKLERNMPLHRVIGEQFIPNPEKYPVIDHLNRNKRDNRVENLRWTTQSINCCNRKTIRNVEQEFIDELPDGYEAFKSYTIKPETQDKDGNIIPADVRELPDLFMKVEMEFDEEGNAQFTPHFITFDSKNQYRRLFPNKRCVKTRDINRKVCAISFSKVQSPV